MQGTEAFSRNIRHIYKERNHATIIIPDYDWGREITARLQELVNLEVGWDGYNGKPVSFENASFAQNILAYICDSETPLPCIVPGVNGDLQIEWHTKRGDIELHIVGLYDVCFWTDDIEMCPNDKEIHLTTNFTQVLRRLRKIVEAENDAKAAAR